MTNFHLGQNHMLPMLCEKISHIMEGMDKIDGTTVNIYCSTHNIGCVTATTEKVGYE